MSYSAMKWARSQPLPTSEKFVLFIMADCAREGDEVAFPSLKTLMADTGLSERTIQRARKALIRHGLIAKEPRYGQSGFRLCLGRSLAAHERTNTQSVTLASHPHRVAPPTHQHSATLPPPPATLPPPTGRVAPPPNHPLPTTNHQHPSGRLPGTINTERPILSKGPARSRSVERNVPPSRPLSARSELFTTGLRIVRTLTGKPDKAARGLLGKWAKTARDDIATLNAVLAEAHDLNPIDPIAWIEKAVQARFSQGWTSVEQHFGMDQRENLDDLARCVGDR